MTLQSVNDTSAVMPAQAGIHGSAKPSIRKRRNPSDSPAQNQGMHIVCAFVGVHHLQVHQMAGHAEFVADAVAAHHVGQFFPVISQAACAVSSLTLLD